MAGSLAIDVEQLFAIDVHVHAGASQHDRDAEELQSAARKHFRTTEAPQTVDETAEYYRERRMACCIWGIDPKDTTGRHHHAVDNDEMLEIAERHRDVFIPFVMVDPWRGRSGVADARRLIDAGARGFKFHPPVQAFYPNERRFYELYEVIAEARLPALFHSGQTGIGAGVRGGAGIHLKYGNPMYLDDVAVDFPDMPIIVAHPSFPWQDEALSVAVHKPQVYIDLSGWSPKYFPSQLVHYSNTLLKHKVLFGSDHPLITPDRWLKDFEGAPFRDEVRPLILKENAARLLGLAT